MAKEIEVPSQAMLAQLREVIATVSRLSPGVLGQEDPEPPRSPDDLIVLSPSSGIPARTGDAYNGWTISSSLCNAYRIVPGANPDSCTIEPMMAGSTQRQVRVFNLSNSAVSSDRFCVTSRLKSGLRYVSFEDCSPEDGYY